MNTIATKPNGDLASDQSVPKIGVRNLNKVFPLGSSQFAALTDVDLDVADGEFVTVVGPSRCGKSTLMNIVAGLEEQTSGQVLVDGKPISGPNPERGVIFQQYALFPWLTVRKNVEFGLQIAGVKGAERRERAQHFIDLVGLGVHADQLPKALSGGMKQRCAIARAYAVNPKLLLMDEPFGALDALTRVNLQDQLLDTWEREKRTVLFVTHDVEEAVYLASRVVVMAARPGRIAEIIDVDIPYPRTEETRLSPEFTEIKNRVWRAVYHQPQPSACLQSPATTRNHSKENQPE
jgi:NitT/TauT family transport system ATP-binding protein